MSRSHPIWIDVDHFNNYRTDKSFGGRNGLFLGVRVGTSGTNSHHFCTIEIHREGDGEGGAVFKLYIDGHEYKAAAVTNKKEYVPEREVVTTLSSDGQLTKLDK
tara:strand:- start:324 stop:635 length:312 start_codon:yes stop_codon:yes gene_type:complete